MQNEDEPTGHSSLAAALPPLKLNPTLWILWEDKRKKEDSDNQVCPDARCCGAITGNVFVQPGGH